MAQPTISQSTTPTTAGAPALPKGSTIVTDAVVAKIAGIAARETTGVYALGGGAARMLGAVRDAIGSTDLGQGVKVQVGETQVAADVTIVVEYPLPLQTVAGAVRTAVASAITDLIGMEVAEVNVTVTDVHLPTEDEPIDDTASAGATVIA